ncbi:hypothetical protein [Spiroplasma tabanidicola]|uniref:Lipoprotein n=1 Tax=Spiroplasma tabanidicola TaxID=324079 RepID=A0A6I6CCA0_9MOLU|nr:hypothetical protein [Spiroplasma tabanidicola]QGS51742.1 hypothetical protein STABA_v1c03790 [Spiroplasma tabanidicola]
MKKLLFGLVSATLVASLTTTALSCNIVEVDKEVEDNVTYKLKAKTIVYIFLMQMLQKAWKNILIIN